MIGADGREADVRGFFAPAVRGIRGELRVPGDKSISHRALLLGAVNAAPLPVTGFLRSADTLATMDAVRALGVDVDDGGGEEVVVHGGGWEGLREPADVIDVRNAGTLIRLLAGLVASLPYVFVLTGDESIRRRPMARIVEPLTRMGAGVWARDGGRLPPIAVRGGPLTGGVHTLEVASAQVKSCLLFAGLRATGETAVVEPGPTRDHTERLLRAGGARVERDGAVRGPGTVRVGWTDALRIARINVPGDLSSAAFLLVAALLVPDSDLIVSGVGLNPTRTGLLDVLQAMDADLAITTADDPATGTPAMGAPADAGLEPIGAVRARTSALRAVDVGPDEVPLLIDELPVWALAAARAEGVSRLRGAAELRVKESDRLSAIAALLKALEVTVVEYPDGLDITGRPEGWRGGEVATRRDHRLALTAAVAGLASRDGVGVDDAACIFGYDCQMDGDGHTRMIIAIDGPAGAGKSTIAMLVAARLGLTHLDTGAMYRAVTLSALEESLSLDDGPALGRLANRLDLSFGPDAGTTGAGGEPTIMVGDRDVTTAIRSPQVSAGVSQVAAHHEVRRALTATQQRLASGGGMVLEGRDIGTVVCPKADVKIFLTASVEERARRRQQQLAAQGVHQALDVLSDDLARRDLYDAGRAVAPLRKADDAVEVDTTHLTIDDVVAEIAALAGRRMARLGDSDGTVGQPC
jgi:3-phosphoshikimate 1-carboxyvinyltransferase